MRTDILVVGEVAHPRLEEDVAVGGIAYLHGFSRPALHRNKPVEIVVAEGFLRVSMDLTLWIFCYYSEVHDGYRLLSPRIVGGIEDLSSVFLHNGENAAYIVFEEKIFLNRTHLMSLFEFNKELAKLYLSFISYIPFCINGIEFSSFIVITDGILQIIKLFFGYFLYAEYVFKVFYCKIYVIPKSIIPFIWYLNNNLVIAIYAYFTQ